MNRGVSAPIHSSINLGDTSYEYLCETIFQNNQSLQEHHHRRIFGETPHRTKMHGRHKRLRQFSRFTSQSTLSGALDSH